MISFPRTCDEARAAAGEMRAGGTDVQARRASGLSDGPVIDLSRLPGLDRIEARSSSGARIGALVRITTLASDPRIATDYPALAAAAAGLATPQIRAVGTLGGNLLQRTRCWYFRHPGVSCYKKGGQSCPARAGNHLFGVSYDLGPCIAPHPSTLGLALLAYDAQIELHEQLPVSIAALYGDGSNPYVDHRLAPGALLTAVVLPQPWEGERAAYLRVGNRRLADWPLVEVVVRLVGHTQISRAAVAVGGIANIPLRLPQLEQLLLGQPMQADAFACAVDAALAGVHSLPATAYKLDLLRECLIDACSLALS